jgi:hypothetical protein
MTKARDLANGGFGLVLIKPSSVVGGTDNGKGTVTFSSASSISLNDVFNSTYLNYKIMLRITGNGFAGNNNISMRFRVSNSDNSANSYFTGFSFDRVGATTGNGGGNPSTSYILHAQRDNDWFSFDMDVFEPFTTNTTLMSYRGLGNDNTSGYSANGGGLHNVASSFTGFSIFGASGNIGTGTVSVYGYNK